MFLDEVTDRYFCLPNAANDAFLRLAAGSPQQGDGQRVRLLVDRGLLIDAGPGATIVTPASIVAPGRDLVDERVRRARPSRIARALTSELHMAWSLRTKPFLEVIDAVRRVRPGSAEPGAASEAAAVEIAAAAAALALVTRGHDRCLVRALAVHRACRKGRVAGSRLVFGVTAHPFAAHCWVQLGDAVLVGGYEQARLFTPILVLG